MSVFPLRAPADRGRLLTAAQVAAEVFSGNVSPRWVREHVTAGRQKLGHRTVLWHENEVRASLTHDRRSA